MPKITLDMKDYESSFDPIPAGTYKCYLFDVKAKQFKSGSEGFACTYNVAEGKYKGRKLFDNLVLTPTAKWKLAQFWKAMTGEQATTIDTDMFKSFVGRLVEVKVGIDDDDRNVVKGLKYTGESQPNAQNNLNDFLENAALGATEPPVVEVSDDDLPF